MRAFLAGLAVAFLVTGGQTAARAADPAADGGAEEVGDAGPDFDVTFELIAATDYYDDGLTQSDHTPVLQPKISLSTDLFYASVWASNVDYGEPAPDVELEFIAGVTPSYENWTFDLSLTRYEYPDASVYSYTYVFGSATYDFGNGLTLSGGYAYYWYDLSADFHELYAAADYTFESGLALHAEASHDFDYDGSGNDYLQVVGGVTVPLPHDLSLSANVGMEHYYTDDATPSYVWFDIGATYALTDWAAVDLRYYGNGLSDGDCAVFSGTDCDHRVVAALTLTQSLSALAGD